MTDLSRKSEIAGLSSPYHNAGMSVAQCYGCELTRTYLNPRNNELGIIRSHQSTLDLVSMSKIEQEDMSVI
jgi:hypothetical protein